MANRLSEVLLPERNSSLTWPDAQPAFRKQLQIAPEIVHLTLSKLTRCLQRDLGPVKSRELMRGGPEQNRCYTGTSSP